VVASHLTQVILPKKIGVMSSCTQNPGVLFQLQLLCFVGALFMDGFGNTLFGVTLPINVSTMLVILALFIQLVAGTFRIPVFLLVIYSYVVFQTFILNYSEPLLFKSLVHFMGLIIFSISIFSFVSAYRYRILYIINVYYKFCFIVACIAIIQSVVFIVFNKTISLQNMLGGPLRPEMSTEIFGIFPRSPGTASEPATFSIILIPGIFMSLLVLTGRGKVLFLKNKIVAGIILTAFILSFSLIGFIGLAVSLVVIAISASRRGRFIALLMAFCLIIGGIAALSNTIIVSKFTGLVTMTKNPKDYTYTTNDLSGFALISNALVAKEGILRSNYLGTGLNTHESSYDYSISSLFDQSQIIFELNKKDAGSLFIRIASEFGVPGLIFLLLFLLRNKIISTVKDPRLRLINDMCFVVIISSSARNGSYFSIVFLLFSAIYLYSYLLAKRSCLVLNRQS